MANSLKNGKLLRAFSIGFDRQCSSIMSEYDKRTGIKHLRVRGFKAVRFRATLKAVGVNIFRATAVRNAVNNGETAHGGTLPAPMHAIYVIKEHFVMAWGQLKKVFILFCHSYGHSPVMVA